MNGNEIKEMATSAAVMFFVVLLAPLLLIGFWESAKLAFFYILLFYLPFLPLAYIFRELNIIEKAMASNIMGVCYVGLYAVLDVFLKIKLTIPTYIFVTLALFCISCWVYSKKK
jgi:hypothetical protein